MVWIREGEGQNREGLLRTEMQQLAARDQELEPGSRTEQRVEQRGSRQDLLEVVQNQQRLARVQVLMEALEERIAAEIGQAQAPGEGGRHTGGISNGGEIHTPDPVREDVSAALAHLEGQTGLADTRRTGQREQPGRAADEQLANQLQLLRASQEARRFCPAAGREDAGRSRGLRHVQSGFDIG